MSESPPPPRRWVALVLIGLAALSFLFAVVVGVLGTDILPIDSFGTDTYSVSAIGHHAFVEMLREAGVPVAVSTWESGPRAGRDGVLVLLEPDVFADLTPFGVDREGTLQVLSEAMRGSRTVLLVLPRWEGQEHRDRDEWVGRVHDVDEFRVRQVLRSVLGGEDDSQIVRLDPDDAGSGWRTGGLGFLPTLPGAQLLRGTAWDPLVECTQGMLVAERTLWPPSDDPDSESGVDDDAEATRLVVITDPGLVATHGLTDPDNAALAGTLVAHLLRGGTAVVDETTHGYSRPPSFWTQALRYPLVLVPIHLLLMVALLLWAGATRFGRAQATPPAFEPGHRDLVRNTASLMLAAGPKRAKALGARYIDAHVQRVRDRLHIPPGLKGNALAKRLDRVAVVRQSTHRIQDLRQAWAVLDSHPNPSLHDVLALAARTHAWAQEMTNGPQSGS